MNKSITDQRSQRAHIVFVVTTEVVGGHEHQAYHVIHDLAQRAEVTVICPTQPIADYFADLPCAVVVTNFLQAGKFWQQLRHVPRTARILAPFFATADKVIVSGGAVVATLGPVYACKWLNREMTCIAYVPAYTDRALTHGVVGSVYNWIVDRLARRPDAYCTINRIQAAIFRKRFGRNVIVLPNKIRTVAAPAESFGKRLVYVGRFDEESKDLSNLVAMLDVPENPYTTLLMIGAGPAEDALKRLAASARHIEISFLPWLNAQEMDSKIGQDDCLIMNSRWEGEPLVVREFIARKLPAITKNVAGFRFIVPKAFRFEGQDQLLAILNRVYRLDRAEAARGLPRIRTRRENALQLLLA